MCLSAHGLTMLIPPTRSALSAAKAVYSRIILLSAVSVAAARCQTPMATPIVAFVNIIARQDGLPMLLELSGFVFLCVPRTHRCWQIFRAECVSLNAQTKPILLEIILSEGASTPVHRRSSMLPYKSTSLLIIQHGNVWLYVLMVSMHSSIPQMQIFDNA